MKKYPLIGSHITLNAPNNYLIGSIQDSIENGANTLMVFTGPPQSRFRKDVKYFNIEQFKKIALENELDINDFVVHLPYLINISNSINKSTWEFGVEFLIDEIKRSEAMGIKNLVLHPGSRTKGELFNSLDKLVEGLNIATKYCTFSTISLETMSGKGTEVGTDFEQMKYVLDRVNEPEKISFCLDTCHLHDAGFDISKWDDLKNIIKNTIGIEKVSVIHLNDSKNELNSHKDRHENIGYGFIGFEALRKIVFDEDFKNIPKILETPYVGEFAPYKKEIEMLINGNFDDWKSKI